MSMNNTIKKEMEDYLVPSLEDLEENPLIRDSFIGVTEPAVKWPPGVEFVEADGSASFDASDFYYHPSQQQLSSSLQSTPAFGGHHRQRQESFNLGQLLVGPEAGQQLPLQPFSQQKSLADSVDGVSFQSQGYGDGVTVANGGSFEPWLEDKADLTLLSSWISNSATIDFTEEVVPKQQQQQQQEVRPAAVVVEEEDEWEDEDGVEGVVEKQQILQEILRECEEIERRSSPGSECPSTVSSPLSSTSPSNSVAPSPRFTWTPARGPVNAFTFKRPQSTTLTLERAASALQPKDVKSRSKAHQKEKKKAQNREAATRYREKKRREREGRQGDLSSLEAHNLELKTQVEDLVYEIDYLRGLMREIGLAK